MIEEIYKWLESAGWVREMKDGCWAGYHIKTDQYSQGAMIINGKRVDAPPVVIKKEIEYTGDGWISNPDGSDRKDTTEWDVRIRQGENLESITIIADSPEQFREMINEMNL